MRISFEVTKVTIITGSGADKIILTTTLPDGCYPYDPHESTIEMRAACGQGAAYILDQFPKLAELITVVNRG
jgi:hypothetical protein